MRKKIFLIVSLTFIGLTGVLLLTSYRILLGGIQDIEIRESRKDLDRAVNTLNHKVKSLDMMAREYAKRNETSKFTTSRNPAFITSNFTD